MTPAHLTDLIIAQLVRAHGGNAQRWRRLLSPVRLYDLATHPHCNWSISPSGSAAETAVIEQLLDNIRLSHPILRDDR